MVYIQKILKLLEAEPQMADALRIDVNVRAKEFLEALRPSASQFLSDELDINKYNVEEVRMLIQSIPSALATRNEDEMYPIQSITWDYSDDGFNSNAIPFLSVLAEEGLKVQVGGDKMRGGILIKQSNDLEADCVLEELASLRQSEDHYCDEHKRKHIERICLDTIKSLRAKGLFRRDDIRRYNLLLKSQHPASIDRFRYFQNWISEASDAMEDADSTSNFMD